MKKDYNLKSLYKDAFYWHLVHRGYSKKRAELMSARIMNADFWNKKNNC